MNFSIGNFHINNFVVAPTWYWRRLLRKADLFWLATVLMISVVSAILCFVYFYQSPRIVDLNRQLLTEKALPKSLSIESNKHRSDLDMARFYGIFPKVTTLVDELSLLFELADKNDLEIDKAQYKLVEKSQGILRRFEVTFPISGSYEQITTLISEVLEQLPSVAISDITLERETVIEKSIKADLRLVFFIRNDL